MGKGFSASTIKSWFQYRCERKVRYELSTEAELAAVPVVKDVREQAWAILGNEYEERVVQRLHREIGVLQPSAGDDSLSEKLTGAFLRGRCLETYAAQVNLRPRALPKFLEGTGLYLNRNLADLLRRQVLADSVERVQFTIIDVKATRRATAFHKAQVAFYVRVLEELLKELALPEPVAIDPFGEIWRIPDDGSAEGDQWEAERFALAPYLRLVDEFCREVLPQIAAKRVDPDIDETFFHLYFKCEQCSFLGHCVRVIAPQKGPGRRDVSAVPGLTHEAKKSLRRLGIRTVSELSAAAGLAQAPGIGWSLSRRAPQLIARAKALVGSAPIRTQEQQTFLMPPRADAVLLLSVDHDPVDDRIAAIGYRRIDGGVVCAQVIEVPRSGSSQDEAAAMIRVLGTLIADLTEIDVKNARLSPNGSGEGGGIYAHIFFYEPSEARNLQLAVGRHLDDDRIRQGLLNLVRLFPPDEVVPEPDFRGMHHLPATAVKSVVEQLWALPVSVSYDLRQVSEAIAGTSGTTAYVPAEKFARPFSSLLSIEVIRALREKHAGAVSVSSIEHDVAARLDALQAVIGWIYAEHSKGAATGSPLLRLAKKPFRFQANFDPLNAVDLDVLLACELLENRAGLLGALINLAQPAASRRDSGRCVAALSLNKHWAFGRNRVLQFRVPEESQDHDFGPNDFDLILTDDSPDLRLDPSAWPSVACRIKLPGEDWEHRRDLLQVQVEGQVFSGDLFQALLQRAAPGTWYIDRAFNDVNTSKAAAFLANLARGEAT